MALHWLIGYYGVRKTVSVSQFEGSFKIRIIWPFIGLLTIMDL